ncbi:EamA family transporter, partial [Aeromicrobium phragmitis]|uniref:EamA family transporter n=1 Tax=Aeromicrobium phragmitis TaxID=2478914 RepID=UPI001AA048D3
ATSGVAVLSGVFDAGSTIDPVGLLGSLGAGLARILVGGGLLAAFAWLTSGRSRTAPTPAVLALAVVGALGVLAYQPTFFLGTEANGVAVGTVVALGSAPVLTGLLEWILT